MVLIITLCWLTSTLVRFEPRQRYTSSFLLFSADYSVFQGIVWMTDENGWWIQAATQPWRCTLCGKDNTAKAKVCAQCNARRAWASKDMPSQPLGSTPVPSPAQTAPGMQTRQQLAQVNSRLRAMESDVSMEPSVDNKPAQEDRSQLSAHNKTLETALATLPMAPQFAKHRGPLEEVRVQTGTRPRHQTSAGSTGNGAAGDVDTRKGNRVRRTHHSIHDSIRDGSRSHGHGIIELHWRRPHFWRSYEHAAAVHTACICCRRSAPQFM